MEKLSVYMITLNEEDRLERTLAAVKPIADELIIVDSGSTDKTEEIAKKYGAKFEYREWISYANQKNYAQNLCKNEWLLSIDADEVLSDKLVEEIKEVKKDPKFDVYKLRIGDMFPGFEAPRKGAKKYNLERLYNRKYADMPIDNLTKDRLIVNKDAKVGQLKGLVHHYSYLTLSKQIGKLNRFTDQVLETAVSENKKYSYTRLVTEFPRQFLRYYFIKRNFLNGHWGFVSSVNHAYFRFMKIAKWFEHQYKQK